MDNRLLVIALLTALAVPVSVSQADIISFSGSLDLVLVNEGDGAFAPASLGSSVSGFIDDQTFNGQITVDGMTESFGCCIAAGGLELSNDVALDADTAALLNQLDQSQQFMSGERVDGVDIEGDMFLSNGNRLEVGVSYLLDSNAFDSEDPSGYPFDPAAIRIALFFILEEDGNNDIYDALGQFTPVQDADNDGVNDNADNCTLIVNPAQLDTNLDGFGNACDPDLDNNNVVNFIDIGLFANAFGSVGSGDADINGDGVVNFLDFAVFPNFIFEAPGPSGLVP
ncbi:MAG: thrombospondin type 3 repeat-containing protein [Pseudomonadota bacterium]